jgi:YfiR/HmsC-like
MVLTRLMGNTVQRARLRTNACMRHGIWFFAVCLLLLKPLSPAQETQASEEQVKAAFIYGFTKFVEWPPQAFAEPNSPFTIGIVGESELRQELEQSVRGKELDGHKFEVKQARDPAELRACQLLFITRSERRRQSDLLRNVAGLPVLTLGDNDRFLAAGGMINFIMEGKKVRFEINEAAARRVGLIIHSRLLSLARHSQSKGNP